MIVRRRSPINGRRQRPTCTGQIALADVVEQVAFEAGLSVDALRGPRQRRFLVEQRAAVAWLGYSTTRASMSEIAAAIGRKFDASAYDHIDIADGLLRTDPDFRALTSLVTQTLEAVA